MMEIPRKEVDVLVIGSGASGAICAWDAARHGQKVSMVSVGTSATEMSSGCVRFSDGRTSLNEMGLDRDEVEDAGKLVERFLTGDLKKTGLFMTGSRERSVQLYRGHGGVISENLVPATTYSGRLDAIKERRIGVIGFEGRTDFDARSFSRSLVHGSDVRIEHRTVRMTELDSRNASASAAVDIFAEAAKGMSGELIFVPPFLPLRDISVGWAELESRSGRVFAEPVTDLGLPGIRLNEALASEASRAGVVITNGAGIVGMSVENGALKEVTVRSGQRSQRIRCKAAVYCGGGIVGGGLGISGREVIDPLGMFDVRYLKEGPGSDIIGRISSGGLRTGAELGAFVKGEKVRNLFVAGASLPGMNIVAGNGIGDAMTTALIASRNAREASG